MYKIALGRSKAGSQCAAGCSCLRNGPCSGKGPCFGKERCFGQGRNATSEALTEKTVDVRTIPPAQRHPMIFGAFENLARDGTFVLVNDHDPKPLFYQFQAEYTGQFTWDYLERGPEVWRVRIGRAS